MLPIFQCSFDPSDVTDFAGSGQGMTEMTTDDVS